MDKPKLKNTPYYDYYDCIEYVLEKYDIKSEDNDIQCDFWLWLLDHFEIHNGCMISLSQDYKPEDKILCQIYDALYTEFGEAELHISW